MIDVNQNTLPDTSRHQHFLNAVSAVLLIVWEMQSRFSIGVRNARLD